MIDRERSLDRDNLGSNRDAKIASMPKVLYPLNASGLWIPRGCYDHVCTLAVLDSPQGYWGCYSTRSKVSAQPHFYTKRHILQSETTFFAR
jgi:hypothetical protein